MIHDIKHEITIGKEQILETKEEGEEIEERRKRLDQNGTVTSVMVTTCERE